MIPQAVGVGAYRRLKRGTTAVTLLAALAVALGLLPLNWRASVALAAGVACGIANMIAIMRGSERLARPGGLALFGVSSLLRLMGFSIVAAAVAARGPWWSLGPFLAGFFFPLVAYAWGAWRAFREKP